MLNRFRFVAVGYVVALGVSVAVARSFTTVSATSAAVGTVCVSQPQLKTLVDLVLPAVAVSGYMRTETISVPGGVYGAWHKKGGGDINLTVWRFGTAAHAAQKAAELTHAASDTDAGTVASVPSSYVSDLLEDKTIDSGTVFHVGIYTVSVHVVLVSDLANGNDPAQELAASLTRGVYDRLTLITGQDN